MMITIMMTMTRKNTDGGKDDDGGEPHWAWFHISLSWCQVPTLTFFRTHALGFKSYYQSIAFIVFSETAAP